MDVVIISIDGLNKVHKMI